jgi:VWFA-related protein
MLLGDLSMRRGRTEDALRAYTSAAEAAPEELRHIAIAAVQHAGESRSPLMGLGPPGTIIFGRRSVLLRSPANGTARVDFVVDGRVAATVATPPFMALLDFGRLPQPRLLEVVERDGAGRRLRASQFPVNERSDAFSVSFLEPSGDAADGEVSFALATRLPRGAFLHSVTVDWNERRVTKFAAPPFRGRLSIAPGEPGVLRAVLRLEDGSEVEDVRLLNAGPVAAESEVHLVEVPVHVPAGRLRAADVVVKERGEHRTVERVIEPAESPLRLALLLDTSWSMEERLYDLQEAALQFVQSALGEHDRAMVVTFDTASRVLWPTNDRELIERWILGLQPGGATAVRDSLATALLQMQATGSRRGVVIFSDGIDNSSRMTTSEIVEVARRSGTPVYVVYLAPPLGLPPMNVARRIESTVAAVQGAGTELMKISSATGGRFFSLRSVDSLAAFFAQIEDDLRHQALVIYRSEASGPEWRPIEISLRKGAKLRAPQGVYVTRSAAD